MLALEEPSADHELGHKELVHEPETSHLHGGIVLFNYDHAIASEAVKTNIQSFVESGPCFLTIRTERRGISEGETVQGQKNHIGRVRSILEYTSPVASWKGADELVLDYMPWIRNIDTADAVLEAASLQENESRASGRGGRMTRNSQRALYQRYFSLSEEHRTMLHGSKLSDVGMGSALAGCSGASV